MSRSAASGLAAVLNAKSPDGAWLFTDGQVLDFLALALLQAQQETPGRLPVEGQVVLGLFSMRTGMPLGCTADQASACIEAHLEKHPLPPGLAERVSQWRTDLATPAAAHLTQAARALLATPGRHFTPSFPRPADAAGASPLGQQLAARAKK